MLPLSENTLFARMCSIRQALHKHPELAYKEKKTSVLICKELDRLGITFQQGLAGGTGILAEIPGSSAAHGPCVVLRSDMDALPIAEETGLSFSSEYSGIMHACGHDGHVATLLGAAALLKDMAFPGKVILLFQPAEESGNGAAAMIEDQVLEGVDMIFSGHIDTHFPVGCITIDEGLICSYTDPFTVTIHGRGGHAARPH
jgi:hippurate hydrolase